MLSHDISLLRSLQSGDKYPLEMLDKAESIISKSYDSEIESISREELEIQFNLLRKQSETLLSLSRNMKYDLDSKNDSRRPNSQRLGVKRSDTRANIANQRLREKIRMLERHISLSDFQRAQMIYRNITWDSLSGKKGVLKIKLLPRGLF